MISAVLVFGKESEEATAARARRRTRYAAGGDRASARDEARAGDDDGTTTTATTTGAARRRRKWRRSGRQGRLRLGGLRGMPHAAGGECVRQCRPEPRPVAPELPSGARPGRARWGRDARLQGSALGAADRQRRGVRRRFRRLSLENSPECAKPARGRGGNRRSHVSCRLKILGGAGRRILQDDRAVEP